MKSSLKSTSSLSINTIRTLTIDSVENAQHGHPGMPLGSAPMAYALWKKIMNVNPANPDWFNRDRFVLSAGHGSMLQYALLHLARYNLSVDDLKGFRHYGSRTPGHPEYGMTPGVEVTTGPLGQGIPSSVGLALAEAHMSSLYNKPDLPIIDHYTYTICSDGDLMEGVSYEAASFAGHMKLGKLIMLYDSNDVSLDGDLNITFSEDIQKRFEAMGWQYLYVADGEDIEEIEQKILEAKQDTSKPTLIEVKNIIGYGVKILEGTHNIHSDPIGKEAVQQAKEFYEWDYPDFHVPEEVYHDFNSIQENGQEQEEVWKKMFEQYQRDYPDLAEELNRVIHGELPKEWDRDLPAYEIGNKLATRVASSDTLNVLSNKIPELFGGSADLVSSNKTDLKEANIFSSDCYNGRNIWFGVREFAMTSMASGMALHGLRPFVSTFFVFSDYMRPAIRLAALMGLPVTYVLTHDSIAVGQDGPTHQPVEQLASFRAMPNISVIRPGDANETKEAWKVAMNHTDKPTMLVLGRQGVPTLNATEKLADSGVKKGAYLLSESDQTPEGLLIAAGSEVHLATEAQAALAEENIYVNVVSMPSWDLFEAQTNTYKSQVLPASLKQRLVIEMGSKIGWREYAGDQGEIMSVDEFGSSGAGDTVVEAYGFSTQTVIDKYKTMRNSKD